MCGKRKKQALAQDDRGSHRRHGVSTDALFDVQIKRIHEYKRQLLNILSTAALYREMKLNPNMSYTPAREDLRRQGGGELREARS